MEGFVISFRYATLLPLRFKNGFLFYIFNSYQKDRNGRPTCSVFSKEYKWGGLS